MCQCNSTKNQTGKDALDFLNQQQNPDAQGIALFLIPAPEFGYLEYKLVAVEGLTMKEAAKRASMCEAFKFFPLGLRSAAEHTKSRSKAVVLNSLNDLTEFACNYEYLCAEGSVHCTGACVCLTYSGVCIPW